MYANSGSGSSATTCSSSSIGLGWGRVPSRRARLKAVLCAATATPVGEPTPAGIRREFRTRGAIPHEQFLAQDLAYFVWEPRLVDTVEPTVDSRKKSLIECGNSPRCASQAATDEVEIRHVHSFQVPHNVTFVTAHHAGEVSDEYFS